ncbi:T9SS type A sorting domain-containing protein [bacterium]|nr:T9SS type A sorting domain-containing protein [bacterium]
MNTRIVLTALLLSALMLVPLSAQDIPFVYDVENTGAAFPPPPLYSSLNDMPVVEPLTDPFEWSDGSGRSTDFADWSRRRAEILAEMQYYETGPKPSRPDTLTASFVNDTLTVNVTENGNTLTLKSKITLPEGPGPFAAVIGMGGPSGSLPADMFTSRGIAMIPFNFGQVMSHTQIRGNEPINRLYPDQITMGAYTAWPWGVSRLIDGLELVQAELPIDLKRLAVTGCSFAGKMALFAGAYDERIALTIAQESGGGGAAAWRVSETQTGVENLGATSNAWFVNTMFRFAGKNVVKLPHDHHELMALVAPRALFVLGNPDYIWLADTSGYVSCRAAQKVWENFGISDRFGFSVQAGHPHCGILPGQRTEIEAFVDKFLAGDTTADTGIHTNPWPSLDYSYWTEWWGTGNPAFPERDRSQAEESWLEIECGAVGASWDFGTDTLASNGVYLRVKDGLKASSKAPTDPEAFITLPFTVSRDGLFNIYIRVDGPWAANNACWYKTDDAAFQGNFSLYSNGWQWKKLGKAALSAGSHTLTLAYRIGQPKLDKICVSDFDYPPAGIGEVAENACVTGVGAAEPPASFSLGQNYPNPFNPVTEIAYTLPEPGHVTLVVYDVTGREIRTLVNENKPAGAHRFNFSAAGLGSGVYVYRLKAGDRAENRKMILIK